LSSILRNELYSDFTSATSEIAMEEFLTRKKLPTAIFCESDEMAFGVYQALRKKGLRVPEDISIVGYDGHDFGVTFRAYNSCTACALLRSTCSIASDGAD
jgi:DNA-binding LacI/PurR family transcriptional regulator